MRHFLVFGSHPALSLAEFCALRPKIDQPVICGAAALVQDPSWDGPALMNLLGGTVKLGNVAGELDLNALSAATVAELLAHRLGVQSLDFGWTAFGGSPSERKKINGLALGFKKVLKARGIASRWVTGKSGTEIAPAAVAKLNLTTKGLDVCLLIHADKVAIGLTTDVQDADAWSLRDYGRPARSARSGMLPPKLARIMVNLAATPEKGTLLDPFCGSGTILMEAVLATRATKIMGSDNAEHQIADTDKNDEWLLKERIFMPQDRARLHTFMADARELSKHLPASSLDRVVTEGYLGPPLSGHETQQEIRQNAERITQLWAESLKAWRPLLKPQARLVMIWPGFRTAHGHAFVDLAPQLESLGYRLLATCNGRPGSKTSLIYQRPNQHVTRRIVMVEPIS